MEESNENLLSSFMQKQVMQKEETTNQKQGLFFNAKNDKADEEEKPLTPEEEEAAKELAEAKKTSRNKAANQNHTRMYAKLVMENLSKILAMAAVIIVLLFAAIKLGPIIIKNLSGLASKFLMSALGK